MINLKKYHHKFVVIAIPVILLLANSLYSMKPLETDIEKMDFMLRMNSVFHLNEQYDPDSFVGQRQLIWKAIDKAQKSSPEESAQTLANAFARCVQDDRHSNLLLKIIELYDSGKAIFIAHDIFGEEDCNLPPITPFSNGIHFAAHNSSKILKIMLPFLKRTLPDEEFKKIIHKNCIPDYLGGGGGLHTPLHCAAESRNIASVKCLLANGANPNEITPRLLLSPLYCAMPPNELCFPGDPERTKHIISLLKYYGADISLIGIGIKGYETAAQKCRRFAKHKKSDNPRGFLELALFIENPDASVFSVLKSAKDKTLKNSHLSVLPKELLNNLEGFVLENYPWERSEAHYYPQADELIQKKSKDKCIIS